MKVHIVTAGMVCLATLTTSACVMRSTYNIAVADIAAKNAELQSMIMQSQVDTEGVGELQQLAFSIARQKEAALSALQQAEQQVETERKLSQERISNLDRMISQLTAKQKSLLYALQRENKDRLVLQSVAEKYTSEFGETDESLAPLSPPLIAQTDKPDEAAPDTPVQISAHTDPAAAPPQSLQENKQTPDPVEDNWLSVLKRWVISLWRWIFH
jgi:uncharacterized phage infection (PIP) family protein YhgE